MTTPATNPPVLLVIRDGWGENPNPAHDAFNAVRLARTPVDDCLRDDWPTTLIHTSGEDVGLPAGTMGNSEVGHQNIGAGRIVDQEQMRITRAIRDGSFVRSRGLDEAFAHAQRTGGRVHLLGLASDGRVHSDLVHLEALVALGLALRFPADRLLVHAITDGRDTGPYSGRDFIRRIEADLRSVGAGRIATVSGRYYAMDRDHRWDRVARAYAALTGRGEGPAPREAASADEALASYYETPDEPSRGGDEFVPPTRIVAPDARASSTVDDGDAVIFFNFRGDRPRELTRAFVLDDEAWAAVPGGGFDRGPRLEDLFFCTMTEYEEGLPVTVAFPRPPKMRNILGAVVSDHGLSQFRCAETEKFAHVTFFFNDYREAPFPGESRDLIPSPQDVTTYDQKPEMSAHGVAETVLARLRGDARDALLVVNFANADMVGHTGNLEAAIRAVEVVDACTGRLVEAVHALGGAALVTADHGNAEQMWDPVHRAPHTAHTGFDVPLIVAAEAYRHLTPRDGGRLADIAPTVLELMGLAVPGEMTGTSLLR